MIFFLLSNIALSETDTQLWLSTNVRKKVAKDLRIEWTQHLRFEYDISQIQSVMPELELRYKPIKPLSLKIGYRYVYEHTKSGDFEVAHRYHFQISTGKTVGPLKIAYRLRYQEKHEEDEYDKQEHHG